MYVASTDKKPLSRPRFRAKKKGCKMSRAARIATILAIFSPCLTGAALAEDYPVRQVKLVVPYDAGGGVDLSARYLAQQLSDQLKQSFIVENRPGVSGISGSQYVADAKADGYTLLYAGDAQAIAPFLLPNLTIDMERDLSPIAMVAYSPFLLVANPKIPATNLRDLVAYVKQHPSEFRWGTAGIGSPDHLALERFDKLAGINPDRIPYKGSAPSNVATLSGEVSAKMAPAASLKSYVDSGQLRGLGVTSLQRIEIMPDMPTFAEQGFTGFEASTWYAIWGPKGMPPALAEQIRAEVAKAFATPELRQKINTAGLTISVSKSPAEFGAFFKSELARNGALIKQLNITVQ